MSEKSLDNIFKPQNVAVIGATEQENSVGRTLMENLLDRRQGRVYPVNPKRDQILDVEAYSSVQEITDPIDLGIVATPAPTVPDIIEECGESGVGGIIVISAGFREVGEKGKKLEQEMENIRQEYGMRIIGPNCLGIIRPSQDLNASFVDQMPLEGNVAFLSQSGALASSTLDWAVAAQFGFSSFVSVGNMVDVDFADLIDYFGRDEVTESILAYIEGIESSREFISASRSFARQKPIMAVKSGKHQAAAEAVASHTGSLAGADEVYDAAFKRCGITRVDTIEDLFTCSETLAKQPLPDGANVAIVTNAGGPGAMTTDAIVGQGGQLAKLSESTNEKLENALPGTASLANPVDVTGGANADEFRAAARLCLQDENVDGVICLYTPVGTLSPKDAAQAIVDLKGLEEKPILASWMGEAKVSEGREILRRGGVPAQSSPEQSVKVFMYLNRYARNLERLYETPEELEIDRTTSVLELREMMRDIAEDGREVLTEGESKKILRSYGIPSPEVKIAESADEAAEVASGLGFPVVLKIHSYDITHKSHVGGVRLDLETEEEVREAYEDIMDTVSETKPDADIIGVSVQRMIEEAETELILGSNKDITFGSTIMFGKGGTDVEFFGDTAIGLPPLNQTLAKNLMEETKIYEQLKDIYGEDSEEMRKLEEYLVRLSQLIVDFPEIDELDINPMSGLEDDFVALDARIIIDKDLALGEPDPEQHLVIKPYPREYIEDWKLEDGTPVTLRPIRPEDEPMIYDLFQTFSEKTWKYRFFGPMRKVTHKDMIRYCNTDYRREMAIVGEIEENGERKIIGVGRLLIDSDENTGEYAVVVGDPWQGLGLGEKLTEKIINVAEDRDLEEIYSSIIRENERMLDLSEKMGFEVGDRAEDQVKATLKLKDFDMSQVEETIRARLKIESDEEK